MSHERRQEQQRNLVQKRSAQPCHDQAYLARDCKFGARGKKDNTKPAGARPPTRINIDVWENERYAENLGFRLPILHGQGQKRIARRGSSRPVRDSVNASATSSATGSSLPPSACTSAEADVG